MGNNIVEEKIKWARLELEIYENGLELKDMQELIYEVNDFCISLISKEQCATDIRKLEILTRIFLSRMKPNTEGVEPPEAIPTPTETEPLIDIRV